MCFSTFRWCLTAEGHLLLPHQNIYRNLKAKRTSMETCYYRKTPSFSLLKTIQSISDQILIKHRKKVKKLVVKSVNLKCQVHNEYCVPFIFYFLRPKPFFQFNKHLGHFWVWGNFSRAIKNGERILENSTNY